jgi:hypothetical protein
MKCQRQQHLADAAIECAASKRISDNGCCKKPHVLRCVSFFVLSISPSPDTLSNGARCFSGVNTVVNATIYDAMGDAVRGTCWVDADNKWGAPAGSHCDQCEGAWLPTVGYIFFNCMYNFFIVLVIKHGNAALLWIILTIRLPLVQIAFAIPSLTNPPDPFRWSSILGLFIILAGLICYRYAAVMAGAFGGGGPPRSDDVIDDEEEEAERDRQAHKQALYDEDPQQDPHQHARQYNQQQYNYNQSPFGQQQQQQQQQQHHPQQNYCYVGGSGGGGNGGYPQQSHPPPQSAEQSGASAGAVGLGGGRKRRDTDVMLNAEDMARYARPGGAGRPAAAR